jgi:predicted SprT family Zn-dependent metalloprotease
VTTNGLATPDAVRAEVAHLLETLCAEHKLSPVPTLEWSSRMRRLLGRAYLDRNLIRLSAWLDEQQAHDTLRHELAHIAAKGRSRSRPHGPRWREWAVRLGVEPRAIARAAPTLAPPPLSNRRYWGLACKGCETRFVRSRVQRGLYHTDCGPRKGKLVRVIRDSYEAVTAWEKGTPELAAESTGP